MPQQINLCTPILLTQKRYLSAQTLAQALAAFLIVGGSMCAYWVWTLNTASAGFKKTLATQGLELDSLKAAIEQSKAQTGAPDAALTQDLEGRHLELQQRQALADALQRGVFQPGWGHAARLQLIAQSIPAAVWITDVTADEHQLQVGGFTLEPAALNDWVGKLAASPLLKGQQLSTVQVDKASVVSQPGVAGAASAPAPRAVWSFSLVSAVGRPAPAAGSKP